MSNVVMYIVTPCVIINAFSATLYQKTELLGLLKNMGLVALIAIISHILMIVAVKLIFRFNNENRRRIMRFAAVFSNAGFVALPLAQALIDTPTFHEGALYAAVFLAVFNTFIWTWGLVNMSGEKKNMSWRKIVFNPGIVGVVVGLFIFTTPLYINGGIVFPSIISEALTSISALNLPLPMLMVGYYLGKADLIAAFRDGWSYFCMALRLLVFPFATLAVLYALGVRGNVLIVSVIGAVAVDLIIYLVLK